MFILHNLIKPFNKDFSNTKLSETRRMLFAYTLFSIITPFTSSITSNILRTLNTLFGFSLKSQRFYDFMASSTIPWVKLWKTMWGLIPNPTIDDRIIVALDDTINTKSGEKIFACDNHHNHAASANEGSYPWSQCIVMVGLLRKVKSRWACLPLDFKFYFMKKTIDANKDNAKIKGKLVGFKSKLQQAAIMLIDVQKFFNKRVLITCDSWFGNNGLWSLLIQDSKQGDFNILSRLRINSHLYALDIIKTKGRGRPRKYGKFVGSVKELAKLFREKSISYKVSLYGKQREVQAYSQEFMLKTMKKKVRVVWVFRKTQYIALFTTDLSLTVKEIIEYYGARWKIESGFKEIKQDIGSAKSQTRNANSVINHLNFCMMATTLTWIYADKLEKAPQRKFKIKHRSSFAFSDIRRIIAEESLKPEFNFICFGREKTEQKTFVQQLLKMVV